MLLVIAPVMVAMLHHDPSHLVELGEHEAEGELVVGDGAVPAHHDRVHEGFPGHDHRDARLDGGARPCPLQLVHVRRHRQPGKSEAENTRMNSVILMAETQDSRRPMVGLILGCRDKHVTGHMTNMRSR